MADQLVRLGLVVVIIMLVSICLYQVGGRASAVEPDIASVSYRR